jgi:hypothetical protein
MCPAQDGVTRQRRVLRRRAIQTDAMPRRGNPLDTAPTPISQALGPTTTVS